MDAADREARTQRAEYVQAAVDGRNVTSGAESTIPTPRSDDELNAPLSRLADDRETIAEPSINEFEAEIDEAVNDLFELTDQAREAVEAYLDVFYYRFTPVRGQIQACAVRCTLYVEDGVSDRLR